jgi:hypothetical protein
VLKLQYGVPLVVTSHEVHRARGPVGAGRCRLVFGHLPIDAHIAVSRYYERVACSFGARISVTSSWASTCRRGQPNVDEIC